MWRTLAKENANIDTVKFDEDRNCDTHEHLSVTLIGVI